GDARGRRACRRAMKRSMWSMRPQLAVDLGTANTVVFRRGEGVVRFEPSGVAIDERTGDVHAVGAEARRMIGRTPSYISATRPLRDGVIADFSVTEQMLRHFIRKAAGNVRSHADVMVCVPSGITQVERNAVTRAALAAGAAHAFLIEEPMAAAIGTATEGAETESHADVAGRDLATWLLRRVEVDDAQVRSALRRPLEQIVAATKDVLEQTPAELSADLIDRGIMLVGGGALLPRLDELLRAETGLPVTIADTPLTTVALGAGQALEELGALKSRRRRRRSP